MSKSSVNDCRKGDELVRYALNHGAEELRQTGSHVVVKLPNGEIEVIPSHPHDLGKGLRAKVVKHLIAAGITLLIALPIIASLGKFA